MEPKWKNPPAETRKWKKCKNAPKIRASSNQSNTYETTQSFLHDGKKGVNLHQTSDPFKILVTTILSARTKDTTTTTVISKLFQKVDTIDDLEKLSISEIEKLIYPAGFYRNKAKSLHKLPSVLKEKFGGRVPADLESLLELPGVGRKTANLVLTMAFEKDGICVDVHVHRISNRLGYVKTKSPFETEMALRKKLPQELWQMYNSYLVSFGQNLCTPRNPHCDICPVWEECKRAGVVTKYTR